MAPRRPQHDEHRFPRTTFVGADITDADLAPVLDGADAVVHLAWLIQPGRDESVVHSLDVGDAFRRALLSDVRGAFNLAADPPIGPARAAELLGARPVKVPASVLRTGAAITHALRIQPSEPGWVDIGLSVPLMDSARARAELGWEPSRSATDTLCELISGIRSGSDMATPPLARATSGPARVRELLTGLGARP